MMAWPWLTAAAKTIPWVTLIRRAPEIIEISAQLLMNRKINQAAKRGTREVRKKNTTAWGSALAAALL